MLRTRGRRQPGSSENGDGAARITNINHREGIEGAHLRCFLMLLIGCWLASGFGLLCSYLVLTEREIGVKVKVKVKVGTRLNRVRCVLGRKDALSGSQVVIQEGELAQGQGQGQGWYEAQSCPTTNYLPHRFCVCRSRTARAPPPHHDDVLCTPEASSLVLPRRGHAARLCCRSVPQHPPLRRSRSAAAGVVLVRSDRADACLPRPPAVRED